MDILVAEQTLCQRQNQLYPRCFIATGKKQCLSEFLYRAHYPSWIRECVYVSLLSLCAKINSSLRGSPWRNLTLLFIPVHPIQPGLEPMGKRMPNPWPGRYSREKTAAPQACSLWYSCYRQFVYIPTLSWTFKTEHFTLVNRKNIAWCLRKMVISCICFGFSLLAFPFFLSPSLFLSHSLLLHKICRYILMEKWRETITVCFVAAVTKTPHHFHNGD